MSSTKKTLTCLGCVFCLGPLAAIVLMISIVFFAAFLALSPLLNNDSGSETASFENCDLDISMVGENRGAMFCEAGAMYNVSAALLVALYCRESGIVWTGHYTITRDSFGADLSENYRDDLVSNCVRNTVTATGPVQIIDGSWAASPAPAWPFGTIADSLKEDDVCSSGPCEKAKNSFDITGTPSRCIWGDTVFGESALVFGKIEANNSAFLPQEKCETSIEDVKLVDPVWDFDCVQAISGAYFGAITTDGTTKVWEAFKQLRL